MPIKWWLSLVVWNDDSVGWQQHGIYNCKHAKAELLAGKTTEHLTILSTWLYSCLPVTGCTYNNELKTYTTDQHTCTSRHIIVTSMMMTRMDRYLKVEGRWLSDKRRKKLRPITTMTYMVTSFIRRQMADHVTLFSQLHDWLVNTIITDVSSQRRR